MNQLPKTGFLRLPQIIGEVELTKEQAETNRQHNERSEAEARNKGKLDKNGNPKYPRRPTTPRQATNPLIPVRKSAWWAGVKSGRFPKPVKIGSGRGTFWRVEDIRALIESV